MEKSGNFISRTEIGERQSGFYNLRAVYYNSKMDWVPDEDFLRNVVRHTVYAVRSCGTLFRLTGRMTVNVSVDLTSEKHPERNRGMTPSSDEMPDAGINMVGVSLQVTLRGLPAAAAAKWSGRMCRMLMNAVYGTDLSVYAVSLDTMDGKQFYLNQTVNVTSKWWYSDKSVELVWLIILGGEEMAFAMSMRELATAVSEMFCELCNGKGDTVTPVWSDEILPVAPGAVYNGKVDITLPVSHSYGVLMYGDQINAGKTHEIVEGDQCMLVCGYTERKWFSGCSDNLVRNLALLTGATLRDGNMVFFCETICTDHPYPVPHQRLMKFTGLPEDKCIELVRMSLGDRPYGPAE